MSQQPTEQDVVEALRHVKDPELNRDLVSLNMIRDVRIEGGAVSLKVVLTTPACPMKDEIEAAIRQAIAEGIEGGVEVVLAFDAKVSRGAAAQGKLELPFARIIAEAENSGCQWFIVEQDTCPHDPFDSLRISFDYLKANLVS